MPSRPGSARRAQALSWVPYRGGQRETPVLSDFPDSHSDSQSVVSKPGAGRPTSVGTPPAHSVLPWRPALFGQVTLTGCSTMLLHTPGLL